MSRSTFKISEMISNLFKKGTQNINLKLYLFSPREFVMPEFIAHIGDDECV